MRNTALTIAILTTFLLGGQTPSPMQNDLLQRELATLSERGVTYRMLAGNQLEVTDPRSGQRWMFDADRLLAPRNPTYDTIPTLTVNLTKIDTSLYNWRFHYVNSLPISGEWGFPLQVGDFNHNGRPEAYGLYQTQSQGNTRIYEQDLNGVWIFKHLYPENSGLVDKQGDIDTNGLLEVYLRYGDSLFVYEQAGPDSLPKSVKFRHRQWYQSAAGIPNQVHDMTGDGNPEVLYRGSKLDSLGQPNVEETFIMKFDQTFNNLKEVWSRQLPPGCQATGCTGAIATGDFDGDGQNEFVTSNFGGSVYVVEHVAADSFAINWTTQLSAAGRATSGDVDGNGVEEFFVGGTQAEADGYVHLRAYVFERTGNNLYQPVFQFNIFPAGDFFVDLYQTADVDGDGIPELLLSFAGGVLIIKGAGEHNYQVFYYQPPFSLDGVAAWKINNNRSATLFVSRHLGGKPVVKRTDVYQLDSSLVTGVAHQDGQLINVRLLQNYPNPFNPTTTISYDLPTGSKVTLKVFDLLGREVATLVNEFKPAGHHQTSFNASKLASGVYLYRLQSGGFTSTKKLLLLK